MFPGFDRIYMLSDPLGSRAYRGNFEYPDPGWPFSQAQAQPTEPIPVSWGMGTGTPGDVIWTTSACPLIVSARVIGLLSELPFTGWRKYPVKVYAKNGDECEGYSGLALTGRFGRVDLSRATIELQASAVGAFRPQFRGFFFAEDTWSGDDMCIGHDNCHRIVTERIAKALKRACVSNIRLERLTDVSMTTGIYECGRTDLLPNDFRLRVQAAYAKRDLQPPPEYQ